MLLTPITRRAFLAGTAAALVARPALAAPRRVATIDWSVLETMLALGAPPIAATELRQFRGISVEPQVPASVVDLGLRGTVNFELLRLTEPDLIFSSSFYAPSEPLLQRIAPVESFSIYVTGQKPFDPCVAMTRTIGERLQVSDEAEALIASAYEDLDSLRLRLKGGDGRPMIPINLGDPRHFRVFGEDSMFGEVLSRLGIQNAWTDKTSYSAWAPIGLEALATVPDAWIVLIPPVPADARRVLPRSVFWNSLPSVKEGRVVTLGSINPFGALPAARRFARLLVDALPFAEKANG